MAILGKLIKKGIKLREGLEQKYGDPFELQKNELLKLLIQARETRFGDYYRFYEVLPEFRHPSKRQFINAYRSLVPIHDYDLIFDKWWRRSRTGEKNVAWPGKVKYFALSSGTSGDSSKFIPVTKDMLNSIQRTSVRQLLTLSHYDLPPDLFTAWGFDAGREY